jgi:hypothetical protein
VINIDLEVRVKVRKVADGHAVCGTQCLPWVLLRPQIPTDVELEMWLMDGRHEWLQCPRIALLC